MQHADGARVVAQLLQDAGDRRDRGCGCSRGCSAARISSRNARSRSSVPARRLTSSGVSSASSPPSRISSRRSQRFASSITCEETSTVAPGFGPLVGTSPRVPRAAPDPGRRSARPAPAPRDRRRWRRPATPVTADRRTGCRPAGPGRRPGRPGRPRPAAAAADRAGHRGEVAGVLDDGQVRVDRGCLRDVADSGPQFAASRPAGRAR